MRTVIGGRSRRVTIVAVIMGATLALAACTSSSSSSPSTTAATSSGGGNSTGNGGGNSGSGGGSSAASRLANLSSSLHAAEGAPFKATYSGSYNGQTQTMTIAQDPPKSSFGVANAVIVDTGSQTYYCPTTANPTCINASSEDPLSSLVDAFSPKAALSQLQAARAAVAGRAAGYNISFSSATFAGQPSTCVTAKSSSASWKYCVTDKGYLAYASSGPQQVFQMTSFSTNVSASDFALPSGATVETIPSS